MADIVRAALCCAHPISAGDHDAVDEAPDALEELLRIAKAEDDFLPIGHPTC